MNDIVVISPELNGGVGDYTRCLAEALAAQGERVTIVTSAAWRGSPGGPVTVLPILEAGNAVG